MLTKVLHTIVSTREVWPGYIQNLKRGESLFNVRDLIQGVQNSAPFNNVRYALDVFEALEEFAARKEVNTPA